jgi:hypothetical protein
MKCKYLKPGVDIFRKGDEYRRTKSPRCYVKIDSCWVRAVLVKTWDKTDCRRPIRAAQRSTNKRQAKTVAVNKRFLLADGHRIGHA